MNKKKTEIYQNIKTDYWIYFNNGMTNFISGNYKQAIIYFTQAIELDSVYAKVYYYRGKCFQALGLNELAKQNFAKARELGYEE